MVTVTGRGDNPSCNGIRVLGIIESPMMGMLINQPHGMGASLFFFFAWFRCSNHQRVDSVSGGW